MDNITTRALTTVISYAVPLIEACGMIIIVVAVIRTVIRYVRTLFKNCPFTKTDLRKQLAQAMVGIPMKSSTSSGVLKKLDAMPSEQVVGMVQNRWTASVGIDGRHSPDYAHGVGNRVLDRR